MKYIGCKMDDGSVVPLKSAIRKKKYVFRINGDKVEKVWEDGVIEPNKSSIADLEEYCRLEAGGEMENNPFILDKAAAINRLKEACELVFSIEAPMDITKSNIRLLGYKARIAIQDFEHAINRSEHDDLKDM